MTKEIPIRCQGTNYLDIHEFQNFQGNLKELKESEFKKLQKSIDIFGFRFPVFVWNKFILDGHQRVFTIDKMCQDDYSIGKIPIVEIEVDSEKEAKQLVLLVSSRYGHVTDEGLYEFISMNELDWEELKTEIDLPEIKPEEFERNFFKKETEGDDDIPEDVEPITKTGDLYELGNHRLLCGDSTKREDVERLMDGKKADMVFTDPSYGITVQSNRRTKSKKFDVLDNDDKILTGWIESAITFSHGWILFCTTWKVLKQWLDVGKNIGKLSNMIIWDKGGGGIGDLEHSLSTDYEIILAYNRGNKIVGKRIGSVWSIRKDDVNTYKHPTQKPIKLAGQAIESFCRDSVLDLFLGSGSTLLACEKTNRICYGCEINEHYVDVCIERYKQFCIKNEIETSIKKNGEVIWP